MSYPTNMFGQPVRPGQTVVITTTSWKSSQTRVARVVRIEEVEKKKYDRTTQDYIPYMSYRVFVRLFKKTRKWDRVIQDYTPWEYKSYVKEVFGISDAVPIDFDVLPEYMQEALKDDRKKR